MADTNFGQDYYQLPIIVITVFPSQNRKRNKTDKIYIKSYLNFGQDYYQLSIIVIKVFSIAKLQNRTIPGKKQKN